VRLWAPRMWSDREPNYYVLCRCICSHIFREQSCPCIHSDILLLISVCWCVSTFICFHSSYGPRASSKLSTPFSERGQFLVDVKFAPFAGAHRRARRGATIDADERRLQTQLTEALTVSIHLEAFPKAVLEAFVTVLQDDGSQYTITSRGKHDSDNQILKVAVSLTLLVPCARVFLCVCQLGVFSSAVTCISLALADAGIMLYDLVTACQSLSLDGGLLLDPSGKEEVAWAAVAADVDAHSDTNGDSSTSAPTAPTASVLLAYMPNLRQISSITQSGSSTTQQVTDLTHMCIAGCEQLSGLMRETLVEAAKKQQQLPHARTS
jgi:exosome complex component MTR3